MIINFELTLEDYIAYNLYHFKKTKQGEKSVVYMFALMAFIVLMILYLVNGVITLETILTILIPFVIGFIILMIFKDKIRIFIINRNYKKGKFNSILCHYEVELMADRIRLSKPKVESFYEYGEVKTVESDQSMIYVYLEDSRAMLIPKRTFSFEEEEQEFLEQLQTNIDKSKIE